MERSHRRDQVDVYCEDWGRERRKVLGINLDQLEPHERLGKLSCTLGRIQDQRVGAGDRSERSDASGKVQQSWPAVYKGEALNVHRAFVTMSLNWRQIMEAHYVWKPLRIKTFDIDTGEIREVNCDDLAQFLGINANEYWKRYSHMKIYLTGFLQLDPVSSRVKVKRPASAAIQAIPA